MILISITVEGLFSRGYCSCSITVFRRRPCVGCKILEISWAHVDWFYHFPSYSSGSFPRTAGTLEMRAKGCVTDRLGVRVDSWLGWGLKSGSGAVSGLGMCDLSSVKNTPTYSMDPQTPNTPRLICWEWVYLPIQTVCWFLNPEAGVKILLLLFLQYCCN